MHSTYEQTLGITKDYQTFFGIIQTCGREETDSYALSLLSMIRFVNT
jgi:hypothetical protein